MSYPELIDYFTAEKHGGMFIAAVGLMTLAFSWFLWTNRSVFLHMAWPVVVIAVIMVGAGVGIFLRTPGQVQALEQGLDSEFETTLSKETARMEKVIQTFHMLQRGEAVIVVVGLVMALAFPMASVVSSLGLGLTLMGSLALTIDFIAHHRADIYLHWLHSVAS